MKKNVTSELQNHEEREELDYVKAIKLYNQAIKKINKAYNLFENSPWGLPEEFERVFNESNENLNLLEKECKHLIEDLKYIISE